MDLRAKFDFSIKEKCSLGHFSGTLNCTADKAFLFTLVFTNFLVNPSPTHSKVKGFMVCIFILPVYGPTCFCSLLLLTYVI